MHNRSPTIFKIIILLSVVLQTPFLLHAQSSNYMLTVKAGELRQSFAGFGASQASTRWDLIAEAPRNQMADMIYRDLKMNVLRLWVPNAHTNTLADMLSQFYTTYIASGAIADITNRGTTILLLAPGSGPADAKAPQSIPDYAEKLAEFILTLRTAYSVSINVTGIANEPESKWSATNIIDSINQLRIELDARGLNTVKIIAPESSNYYSASQSVRAICNNTTAWNDLFGIACHSYGTMPNNDLEVLRKDKPWWITEASGNDRNEQAEDENYACTILNRFLCELNHGAEEWVYFIGLGQVSDISTYALGTAFLVLFDVKTSSVVPLLKYYYFKQALNVFDKGCLFRKCLSATEGDMFLTDCPTNSSIKQLPAMNAAAAYNPDGSWGISIVNNTGVTNSLATSNTVFYAATSFNVTVAIEELTNNSNMVFTVYRSRAFQHNVNSGTVAFTNGVCSLTIAPRELVSLRSDATGPAIPPTPEGLKCSTNYPLTVLTWNNTMKATGWKVKRATTSGGPYTTIATPATTSYSDTTALNRTVYYYVVSATNAVGESANSAELAAWMNNPYTTWTGAVDQNWNVAGNWSAGAVPGEDDKALLTNNLATFTVNVTQAPSAAVGALTISNFNASAATTTLNLAAPFAVRTGQVTIGMNGILNLTSQALFSYWGQAAFSPFFTVRDGGEIRIMSGGSLRLTNLYASTSGVLRRFYLGDQSEGRMVIGDDGEFAMTSITDTANTVSFYIGSGAKGNGKLEMSGDSSFLFSNQGSYGFVVGGSAGASGTLSLKDRATCLISNYFYVGTTSSTGIVTLADNAILRMGGASSRLFLGHSSKGYGIVTIRDHALWDMAAGSDQQLYVGGSVAGGFGVVNVYGGTVKVNSTFNIGHASTGILNITNGYVCGVGNYSRGIALALATSQNSAGYAEVHLAGGALVAWASGSDLGGHSGFVVGKTATNNCRSFAKLTMTGGSLTNRNFFLIGQGEGATGIVEQTGGFIIHGVGTVSERLIIGFGGGSGRYGMANGHFSALKNVYVGGLCDSQWNPSWDKYAHLYKSKPSEGLLRIDGGTFTVNGADIRVGGLGKGTLVIGQNGICAAENITFDTNTSSTVRFEFGPSGIGLLRAAAVLTVHEGAKLEIDTTAYKGFAEWVKLIDCSAREGAFRAEDISVSGKGVVHQDRGDGNVWIRMPRFSMILLM